jgi:hypothetical protein
MSRCQDFLAIHANLMLATPRVAFKSPLSLQVLQAYMADEDLRIKHSEYMHSREFLFIPVHKSPLLIALIPRSWHYRYTDSFESLSMLWSIISSYSTLLNISRDELIKQSDEMDEKMFEAMNDPTMDEKKFCSIMSDITIQRIQIHERFLWDMLKLKFPVEQILTPSLFPTIQMLQKDDQDKYYDRMAHYFETKEALRNVREEKATPEGEFKSKNYFPNKGRNNLEYYKFLKINE